MKPTLVKHPAGHPATNIAELRATHPDLAKRADKALVSLSKRNLAGIRAQCLLYLDHSGSMRADYASGRIQALVERALAFTLAVDTDGEIPVTPWDTLLHQTATVTTANYHGVVDRQLWHRTQMGRTALHLALADILDRAVRARADAATTPLFAIIVTDGNPDRKPAATRLVCELSHHPVFLKFLGLRDVPYLDELDDLGPDRRLVDNADTKKFPDLAAVSDLEFADAMADEWDTWATAARQVGVIT